MTIFQPKLVMIDVDGTLVDSVPDLAYCVDQMMIALNMPLRGEDTVRHWVGNGVPKLVERALTGELDGSPSKEAFDKAYPIFLDLYAQNSFVRSTLQEGVIAGLEYLKSKDYLLGSLTNKAEQFTHPLLKSLGIFDYFGVVISGDTLERKKPDPMPLIHSADFFNVKPNECLMLGDSISDVKAARAANFQIICMSYGYNHGNNIADENPDLVIDSMKQLRDYLQ